nr:potassium-transporting ATPase subunit F [Frigoribacterium sp. CG_9.8]
MGGREAVIVFSIIAVILAIAALVYLVYALITPEAF